MKVLIHGDDKYLNYCRVNEVLDKVHRKFKITELLIPGSRGVAECIILWGMRNGVKRKCFYKDDSMPDSAAAVIRIGEMLAERPDLVIVFPGAGETLALLNRVRLTTARVLLIPEEETSLE